MSLDREELLRLARLARLAIHPEEEAAMGEAVARLIAFGETLPEVANAAAEAAAGAAAAPPAAADDAPGEPLPREAVEAAAPAAADGLVPVPPPGARRR